MIYEAYQITTPNGSNKFIDVGKNKKLITEKCKTGVCVVIEKIRASSFPSDYTIVKDGVIKTSGLLTPRNNQFLRNPKQAQEFWSTKQIYFK